MDEEDKFTISSSPADALDLLATSDDRIGLLLAEVSFDYYVTVIFASLDPCYLVLFNMSSITLNWCFTPDQAQFLARDDEESFLNVVDARTSESSQTLIAENGEVSISTDNQIRKMLTDMFIDNVRLRKQVNSVIRCALNTVIKPEESEESHEVPSRNTVLNRFL